MRCRFRRWRCSRCPNRCSGRNHRRAAATGGFQAECAARVPSRRASGGPASLRARRRRDGSRVPEFVRDWGSEATHHPSEALKAALAHTVRDNVEAAYRRTKLFQADGGVGRLLVRAGPAGQPRSGGGLGAGPPGAFRPALATSPSATTASTRRFSSSSASRHARTRARKLDTGFVLGGSMPSSVVGETPSTAQIRAKVARSGSWRSPA